MFCSVERSTSSSGLVVLHPSTPMKETPVSWSVPSRALEQPFRLTAPTWLAKGARKPSPHDARTASEGSASQRIASFGVVVRRFRSSNFS